MIRTRSTARPWIRVPGGTIRPLYYYGLGLRFGAYVDTPTGVAFAGLHESANRAAIAVAAYPLSACDARAYPRARRRLLARLLCHLARDCIMRLDTLAARL